MATNFGTALAANGLLLSVICGDGNCYRRATVRLGIDMLIANILVATDGVVTWSVGLSVTTVSSAEQTGSIVIPFGPGC